MVTLSGEDFAERLETGIIGSRMKTHAYNIYQQYSELKLERDPWKKNVILSVDFSRNYDNKQLQECLLWPQMLHNIHSCLLCS